MAYNKQSFLLIELLIVLTLVTLLITLFFGGQAHLLAIQGKATKNIYEVNELIAAQERLVAGKMDSSAIIQIEKLSLPRPIVTGTDDASSTWFAKVQGCLCSVKPKAGGAVLALPCIRYVPGNGVL